MASEARARKIGDLIKEELATLLQKEAADPRLEMVTVTEVDVDRELAFARVYVTALGGEERQAEVMRAMEGARGFLRSSLAAKIPLRSFPQLRFIWDVSTARGARIDELLSLLKEEQKPDGGQIDGS
ncbi:MAG: 30S ribosome-binding factor RbfA [Anaerolineales bacterium]|nr:30S ribosome-binding factor RbfA [Anaerolineales bacterium]